ncbi:MAG: hypothetical protein EAZ57_04000 [Cytophagales bacterium]|nr:MAG: hypothetical protein EAZ67_05015 [Cytophagales bacterium]TAF61394.1 MAG: hypothetical protein EAZ57_04000 [Cytophagales bacterium]
MAQDQEDNTPKYSNEFLAIGVGARGLALSRAYNAVCFDATAGYWNPAGLLGLSNQYDLLLTRASFFGGVSNYDHVGFANRNADSTQAFGLTFIRMGIDDIPDTRLLVDANGGINYDRVRSFSEASYAFMFSYARLFAIKYKGKDKEGQEEEKKLNIRTGASVKVIHRVAGPFAKAWGFGIDLGAHTEYKKFLFGLTLRDISTTYNAWNFNEEEVREVFLNTGNEVPLSSTEITLPTMVLGVARPLALSENIGLTSMIGLETTFDGKRNVLIKSNLLSISPSIGVELDYKNMAFLRGGVGNFQQIKNFDNTFVTTTQPSFGVGFKYKLFVVDYALTNVGGLGGIPYSHVFSLRVAFAQEHLNKIKNLNKPKG